MANTVVMKFGGTSVGSTDRIANVAKRVSSHIKKTGDHVVVVVSAMSGETDKLVELSRKVTGGTARGREYHQLLVTGEQVTIALTAMALKREGVEAMSFTAPQLDMRTEEFYGQHLLMSMKTEKLRGILDKGIVPVIAGFQGIDEEGNYTTLGRGGSDTTAVAVAAALKAEDCWILTDIDGVYTALPSLCKAARKLPKVTFEEMIELASSGAKVLQARSVALAKKFKVPLLVASSFNEIEGTRIVEEYEGMEDAVVSGITCRSDESKVSIRNIPDAPGTVAKIFNVIAETGINVDMIVHSGATGKLGTVSFTVASEDLARTQEALSSFVTREFPESNFEVRKNVAKLSVVGEGMRTHAGVAAQMFQVLGQHGINIDMITTSEIKISVTIDPKYAELAVRVLHEFFIEKSLMRD